MRLLIKEKGYDGKMIYVNTLGAILLVGFILKYGKVKQQTEILLWFSFIVLGIVAICRATFVGTDLKTYLEWYEIIESTPPGLWKEMRAVVTAEYGYILFCKVLSVLNLPSRGYIIVTSLFILSGPIYLIKKYSRIPWLSIWIYIIWGFYTGGFNIIRQSMALSILCFTIPVLLEKKALKFASLVLLASFFHKTAVLFLILLIYNQKTVLNIYWCIWGGSNLLFLIFGEFILQKVLNMLFHYDVYSRYIGQGNSGGFLLLSGVLFSAVLLLYKDKLCEEKTKLFLIILSLAFSLSILTTKFSLMSRVTENYLFFMILIIPDLLFRIDKKGRALGVVLILCATLFYGSHFVYRLDYSNVFPYQSFIQSNGKTENVGIEMGRK